MAQRSQEDPKPRRSKFQSREKKSRRLKSQSEEKDYREHFTIIQDPRHSRQRSQVRCLYCDTEFRNETKYRQQHLMKCTQLPESVARPPVVPVVLPGTLSKHFTPLVHPDSKAPQAKCLYCKRALASLHSINLKNHIARCVDAPEEAKRDTSQSRPPKPPSAFLDHFIFFNHSAFKLQRVRCVHCSKEFSLQMKSNFLEQHLAQCLQVSENGVRREIWHLTESTTPIELPGSNRAKENSKEEVDAIAKEGPKDEVNLANDEYPTEAEDNAEKENDSEDEASEALVDGGPVERRSKSVAGAEIIQHFTFFTDRQFKMKRARCLHCSIESGETLQTLRRHLARCLLLPNDVARPSLICPTCRDGIPASCFPGHRYECKQRFWRCPGCSKAKIPVEERPSHRRTCEPKTKTCGGCGNHVPSGSFDTHRATCNSRRCYRCRRYGIPKAGMQNHLSTCSFQHCQVCRKSFSEDSDFKDHIKCCGYRRCSNCRKARIPVESWDNHVKACSQFKRCNACTKTIPVDDFMEHTQYCLYRWCGRCFQREIRIQDVEQHRQSCQIVVCKKCNKHLHQDKYPAHVCTKLRCRSCQRFISVKQLRDHESSCEYIQCSCCNSRLPNTYALEEHIIECADRARTRRYQYPGVANPALGVGWRGNSNVGIDNAINSQQLLAASATLKLLDHKTQFPRTHAINRIMQVWSNDPYSIVIADFEYHPGLIRSEGIFELALANAHGDWIVPPTSINHHISTKELYEKAKSHWLSKTDDNPHINESRLEYQRSQFYYWRSLILKYYGSIHDAETPGLSWEEIADLIDTYTSKHGRLKIFLDWGNNGQDYECLYHGMQKAGRLDLLPPRPKGPERPLSWWCTLRKRLNVGVCTLPLGLGHLHRMIYPEQTGLFQRWHNAGVDVIMTIRLINVYFCKLRNSPIPGKLENYFSPISTKPGTKRKRGGDEMQDEFMPSSEIEDDETLCMPEEEETLEAEADCIDDEIWDLGFEGGDDGVDSDAEDSDLADDSDFEEVEGVAGDM